MITLNQAKRIANEFGIYADYIIVPEMEQANKYDGDHGTCAKDYFRMYMQEIARVCYAEEMSVRQFQRDVYGE